MSGIVCQEQQQWCHAGAFHNSDKHIPLPRVQDSSSSQAAPKEHTERSCGSSTHVSATPQQPLRRPTPDHVKLLSGTRRQRMQCAQAQVTSSAATTTKLQAWQLQWRCRTTVGSLLLTQVPKLYSFASGACLWYLATQALLWSLRYMAQRRR